jgi:hypothetical protein
MNIHAQSPALQKGQIQTYDNRDIVNFYRLDGIKGVYVAVNIRNEAKTLRIPDNFAGISWTNLLDNSTITLPESIEMQAYEYLIFAK